jgi:hypothetical protein
VSYCPQAPSKQNNDYSAFRHFHFTFADFSSARRP